jgi:hypothetical protein
MGRSVCVLMCLIGTACGSPMGNGGDATAPLVHDSLGVVIVEYEFLTSPDSTRWILNWSDTVRIGRFGSVGGNPEYFFGQTRGSVRLAGGRVAVADRLANGIHIFDPDGTFAKSVGRRGQGPGEFMRIQGLLRVAGDSVLALDAPDRWTLLDPTGEFVSTGRVDLSEWPGEEYPVIEGAFGDGTLLVSHGGFSSAGPYPGLNGVVMAQSWSRFYRADRSGAILADFGTFPRRTVLSSDVGRSRASTQGWRAVSPGRGPQFIARGDRFFWVSAGVREVYIFLKDGGLERILRIAGAALEIEETRPEGPEFYSDAAPEPGSNDLAKALQDLNSEIGPSPFTDFAVDEQGYMWFRELARPDHVPTPAVRWFVFDPSGMLKTSVRLPSRWRAAAESGLMIGADYVLALERNDFQEETFLVVPLLRDRDPGDF